MKTAFFAAALTAAAMVLPDVGHTQDLNIKIGPRGLELGVDKDHDRDHRDHRPRCYDRDQFRDALAYQGWRNPHDWDRRGDRVQLKASQWGGLYSIEVDECYAQLISARRIDFDRGKWDRDRWERDYYHHR